MSNVLRSFREDFTAEPEYIAGELEFFIALPHLPEVAICIKDNICMYIKSKDSHKIAKIIELENNTKEILKAAEAYCLDNPIPGLDSELVVMCKNGHIFCVLNNEQAPVKSLLQLVKESMT